MNHKIHSSGDYKNPPPRGEHAGLYRYSKAISGKPVVIPKNLREIVGTQIRDELVRLGHRILVISVAGTHCHCLVELPDDKEPRNIKLPCFSRPWMDFIVPLPVKLVANDHTVIEFLIGNLTAFFITRFV